MEWRDLLLMHTKVINSCNHQLLIIKRSIKHLIKNLLSSSSYHQVLILFLMYRNLLKTKDFQVTNSNISLWVKVCKKKQIFIFQLPLIEVIGWCYKIVIYCLLGWKITLKSSYKRWANLIKTLDFGWLHNRLMLSPWVFFKSHLKS